MSKEFIQKKKKGRHFGGLFLFLDEFLSAQCLLRNVDRFLFFAERPAQLRQRNILQLPNPLSGHPEFLTDFFESLRFAAVQPEALEDNLPLAVVQYLQKLADFVAQILISEQLEGRLRIFIADDLALSLIHI